MIHHIIALVKSKLRYKIMFFLFLLMTISSFVTIFATLNNIKQANIESTQNSLEMLNQSIFQSLRTAMNTGDPVQIQAAENHAKKISGVKSLDVAKSKELIALYSQSEQFTNDKDILQAFDSKQTSTIEYDDTEHSLRMIQPMVASSECLACHANQKEGDVIGVIDLTFSLERSDGRLYSIMTNVFIISTILGWLTLIIIFVLLKKSTEPIEVLEGAIKNLSEDDSNHNEITINSSDEIRKVADYFNIYVQKAKESAIKDTQLINEAKEIIEMVKKGNYDLSIVSNTSNKQLNEFKISVNEMMIATNSHLQNINQILECYGRYDYTAEVSLKGISEGCVVALLEKNINKLKDAITHDLLENQANGQALENSSHILIENVNLLSVSTNKAAASLEETAAALEQITTNISSTTSDVIDMSNLANRVTNAAKEGELLATQTAKEMEEIDYEVSSINDAIKIIDQIAFQTNILSLNAAVEAATAGEAGKGFAVVAGEVRNLASRSSEAANEIKQLVFNATAKANNGKKTARGMIDGYKTLNETIIKTIDLIKNVEAASKEQKQGIQQINDAVNSLDAQTQQNALIASKTFDVAKETDAISKVIVADLGDKVFIGKK